MNSYLKTISLATVLAGLATVSQADLLDTTASVTSKTNVVKNLKKGKAPSTGVNASASAQTPLLGAEVCADIALNTEMEECLEQQAAAVAAPDVLLPDASQFMPMGWLIGLPVVSSDGGVIGTVKDIEIQGEALRAITVVSDDGQRARVTRGLGSIGRDGIVLNLTAADLGFRTNPRSTMGMPLLAGRTVGQLRDMPVFGSDDQFVGWVENAELMGGRLIESITFRTERGRIVHLTNGIQRVDATQVELLIPSDMVLSRATRRFTELVIR